MQYVETVQRKKDLSEVITKTACDYQKSKILSHPHIAEVRNNCRFSLPLKLTQFRAI